MLSSLTKSGISALNSVPKVKNLLDSRTTALIALDVDGVFNECYASELYSLPYTPLMATIEAELTMHYAEVYGESLTIDNFVHRTGVMQGSIRELDYYPLYMVLLSAHETAQFVLTSSWVFTTAKPMSTMDTLEFVFQKVKPRDLPYFAATTNGGSGSGREDSFKAVCVELGWNGIVLALDDSAHFFKDFGRNSLLVAVDTPNCFTALNLHEALLIQGKASTEGRKLRTTKFKHLINGELRYVTE